MFHLEWEFFLGQKSKQSKNKKSLQKSQCSKPGCVYDSSYWNRFGWRVPSGRKEAGAHGEGGSRPEWVPWVLEDMIGAVRVDSGRARGGKLLRVLDSDAAMQNPSKGWVSSMQATDVKWESSPGPAHWNPETIRFISKASMLISPASQPQSAWPQSVRWPTGSGRCQHFLSTTGT